MSRPFPQEHAQIDAASGPRDCRKCAKCFDVEDGQQVWCRHSSGAINRVPWSDVVGVRPCGNFEPKPAPASPPASADREGADAEIRELAEAMLGIRKYATGDYFGDRAYATAIERSERALLLPGVVAARFSKAWPAVEDPRDALLRQCATLIDRVAARPASEVSGSIRYTARTLLVALRAAGAGPATAMEDQYDPAFAGMPCCICGRPLPHEKCGPAPTAQEGKASRPATVRHGETCEKAAHSGTGYLHDENDDTPYDVDGLLYCGRCHRSIDR